MSYVILGIVFAISGACWIAFSILEYKKAAMIRQIVKSQIAKEEMLKKASATLGHRYY